MAKGILNVGGGVVSVDASGNFTVDTGLIADGASVFNETGVDVDFRIESDDNANMFFVDTKYRCFKRSLSSVGLAGNSRSRSR